MPIRSPSPAWDRPPTPPRSISFLFKHPSTLRWDKSTRNWSRERGRLSLRADWWGIMCCESERGIQLWYNFEYSGGRAHESDRRQNWPSQDLRRQGNKVGGELPHPQGIPRKFKKGLLPVSLKPDYRPHQSSQEAERGQLHRICGNSRVECGVDPPYLFAGEQFLLK